LEAQQDQFIFFDMIHEQDFKDHLDVETMVRKNLSEHRAALNRIPTEKTFYLARIYGDILNLLQSLEVVSKDVTTDQPDWRDQVNAGLEKLYKNFEQRYGDIFCAQVIKKQNNS
jgi:hypothetical protein